MCVDTRETIGIQVSIAVLVRGQHPLLTNNAGESLQGGMQLLFRKAGWGLEFHWASGDQS